MKYNPPKYLTINDSSATFMRAMAAFYNNKHFHPFGIANPFIEYFLKGINLFGCHVVKWAVETGIKIFGTPPYFAEKIKIEELCQWATSLYPKEKKYDVIVIGAPNGGGVHLCSILNAPYLTTHFLISFRDFTAADDIITYQKHGQQLSEKILRNNPNVAIINHYDPLHDRFLIKYVNHIRLKLLTLHPVYENFIISSLNKNGKIVLLDCQYLWKQYKIMENLTFQVGGLGDVSDEEFIEGSERIEKYKRSQGSTSPEGGWKLNNFAISDEPESEWGLLSSFKESVIQFANQKGIEILVLTVTHPEEYSELALYAHCFVSEKEKKKTRFLFFDCFTNIDPIANLTSRLIPCWLPFNCEDSFRFAERILQKYAAQFEKILITLVPSFCDAVDTPPANKWYELLSGYKKAHFMGVNFSRYPLDINNLFNFPKALRKFCMNHIDRVKIQLQFDELKEISKSTTY